MSIVCFQNDQPKYLKRNIDINEAKAIQSAQVQMKWKIICEVHYGLNFAKPDSDYQILVRWAD